MKLYNENAEEDSEGLIRLMPLQYQTIRFQFGDTYTKRAFTELTNYIKWLTEHLDDIPNGKQKLRKYTSGTHNIVITRGWVFEKCKQYIVKDRVTINVNPYEIDDFKHCEDLYRIDTSRD